VFRQRSGFHCFRFQQAHPQQHHRSEQGSRQRMWRLQTARRPSCWHHLIH
jgi:hypothetical protein